MKKKLLSMFLALVMALGMAVIGGAEDAKPEGERTEGAQEKLHMLWDIPWGSTPEEVMRLAKENANVSLVPIRSDDVDLWQGLQKVSMFGYPVSSIQFIFNRNKKLDAIEVFFDNYSNANRQIIAEASGMAIEEVYTQVSGKYGKMVLGSFGGRKTQDDKMTQYQFPIEGDGIDYRLIVQAAIEQKYIRLYMYWDNVLFSMYVNDDDNEHVISMNLSFDSKCFKAVNEVRKEELLKYPKDPLFHTMKEIVDGTGPDINVGI